MPIPEEGHPSFDVQTRATTTGQAVAVSLTIEVSTGALKQRVECELTAKEAETLGVVLQRTASGITLQGGG
jgi:hypothetical protein